MSDLILVQLTDRERAALGRLPEIEALLARLASRMFEESSQRLVTAKDMLTPRQVGALCGCNAEMVRKAVVMGALSAVPLKRTRGGRPGLLVKRSDAADWLARGRPVAS